MPRQPSRPSRIIVSYRGIPYVLDLRRCRRALVGCHMEGKFDSMEALADAVGISRSTASRFFSGRPTSLNVTRRIVEAIALKLDDALTPATPDDLAALGGNVDDAA
jgi:transcriptional regulator with XRE-family HTH domain